MIRFYEKSNREYKIYDLSEFEISEDLKEAICPCGHKSIKVVQHEKSKKHKFLFDKNICNSCPKKEECTGNTTKFKNGRFIEVHERYDAVLTDKKLITQEDYIKTINKRYKIERRFALMLRKFGLRRSRYIGLERTKIHILLCNYLSNVIRMVNLIASKKSKDHPGVCIA